MFLLFETLSLWHLIYVYRVNCVVLNSYILFRFWSHEWYWYCETCVQLTFLYYNKSLCQSHELFFVVFSDVPEPGKGPKSVRISCLIELFCGVVCDVILPFWHFCWCRGFCHRTWYFLALLHIESSWIGLKRSLMELKRSLIQLESSLIQLN